MDVRFFLEQRLAFISQLYTNSIKPFEEIKRLIEAEEEPYIPPYSEEGEPPFLHEWLEADESLQVLGRTCVSMLSASFHLYFKTLEPKRRISAAKEYSADFKRGWFNGYRAYFRGEFKIMFEDSKCNLSLLEELVLARNRVQHPEWIASHSSHYSDDDLKKLPSPFFIDVREIEFFSEQENEERNWLMPPTIHVTQEKLQSAVSEISRFALWLEAESSRRRDRRSNLP